MVKSEIGDITTYYASAAYQVKTDGTYTNTRKYYTFNGAVVAMRENGVVSWLLQDQVNSTTVTVNADGSFQSEVRYSAYGEMRYAFGSTITDKLYTGQQQEGEIGLSYYIARFYDPVIAHFIQPDSLIPQAGASASYNRYAYVNGNPINFNDPSGHAQACADGDIGGGCGSAGTYIPPKPGIKSTLTSTWNWYAEGWKINRTSVSIITNPKVQPKDKVVAVLYTTEWVGAHIIGGIGVAGVACGLTPACAAAIAPALGIGTTAATTSGQNITNSFRASNFLTEPYSQLKNTLTNTGLQAHHIVEQRLAPALGQSYTQAKDWLSVALTKEQHQAFTNAWRDGIGFINSNNPINTATASGNDVWRVAQEVYQNFPTLLDAARQIIFGK
jgi:RHS repeat-associated protein